jgi:tRNA-splicing ligase RtcB (3'-phosphate/5'-hydroxy nucleic acid ligase)
MGQRNVPKSRKVDATLGRQVVIEGASPSVCNALGIPAEWPARCEDSVHAGHDETQDALADRIDRLLADDALPKFAEKITQLGSYGGGNHFGECEVVQITDNQRAGAVAQVFGLIDGHVAFLSHCGSRGLSYNLASGQFRSLQEKFETWGIPLPDGDRELVYAPLGTPEADAYLDDMALGANFATVNHLLINALVLEAFQEVFPGVNGHLVYFISHNIARKEVVDKCSAPRWPCRL